MTEPQLPIWELRGPHVWFSRSIEHQDPRTWIQDARLANQAPVQVGFKKGTNQSFSHTSHCIWTLIVLIVASITILPVNQVSGSDPPIALFRMACSNGKAVQITMEGPEIEVQAAGYPEILSRPCADCGYDYRTLL